MGRILGPNISEVIFMFGSFVIGLTGRNRFIA